ncbi:MAG TPA: hypothetical protein PLE74_12450, partial [Candidatus Cloacimonadota bacterium]|nr:hypothetical protein [Candidatus Cloacimonadota bacterium]
MFSKWHKIDLHIHTDISNETKLNDYKGQFCVKSLHSKLIERNVELISLTDHNIINCPAYQSFQLLTPSIELLVGVELDIAIDDSSLTSYMQSQINHTHSVYTPYHALVIFKSKNFQALSDLLEAMYSNISTKVNIDCHGNKYLRITTFDYLFSTFENEDFSI